MLQETVYLTEKKKLRPFVKLTPEYLFDNIGWLILNAGIDTLTERMGYVITTKPT